MLYCDGYVTNAEGGGYSGEMMGSGIRIVQEGGERAGGVIGKH